MYMIKFVFYKRMFLYEANETIRTGRVAANQTRWFITHIKRLINERNTAYTRWRKFKTPELRILFQKCRKSVVKSIERTKKKLYYQRIFSSVIDSSSKWKEIRKVGIGKHHVSSYAVAVNSLNHMFRYANIPSSTSSIYDELYNVPIEDSFTFRCVSQVEVLSSFRSIKSKATGIDELNSRFLKYCCLKFCLMLLMCLTQY